MSTPAAFRAFRIHDDASGYHAGVETLSFDDLSPGEIVVRARHSSVNYKDALAGTGQGKILRRFPLVGGIDVAGHVVASTDPAFMASARGPRIQPGQEKIGDQSANDCQEAVDQEDAACKVHILVDQGAQ